MKERSPGSWRLRAYAGRSETGSPIYVAETFHGSRRAADSALRQLVERVETAKHPQRQATLASVLTQWLDYIEPRRTRSTMHEHRRVVEISIVPALGKHRLDRLSAEHLDRAYATWAASGLATATIARRHAIIRAALTQAVKWGWVANNVAQRATLPSGPRTRVRSPSAADVRALIRAAEDDDPLLASAVLLAALTGARRGELCALRWSDYDPDEGTLRVARSLTVIGRSGTIGPTKTHAERSIVLDQVGQEVVLRRMASQRELALDAGVSLVDDPWLLGRRPDGATPLLPDGLSHSFRGLTMRCGQPWHLHQLRHFAATALIAAGIDPRAAADRMGHSDPALTLRVYTDSTSESARAAAEVLGKALGPRVENPVQLPPAPPPGPTRAGRQKGSAVASPSGVRRAAR